jgi:hypothetical protein
MFSPLPLREYVPVAPSNCAEPGWSTVPTSCWPSKIPSGADAPVAAACAANNEAGTIKHNAKTLSLTKEDMDF